MPFQGRLLTPIPQTRHVLVSGIVFRNGEQEPVGLRLNEYVSLVRSVDGAAGTCVHALNDCPQRPTAQFVSLMPRKLLTLTATLRDWAQSPARTSSSAVSGRETHSCVS